MTASIDINEAKAILKETYKAIQTVQENLAYLSQILNQPPQLIQQQQPQASIGTVEEVRMLFPKDLNALLIFEDKPDYVVVKPKHFLGSEYFAKIANIVRSIGGEYISLGRDSHFRVYKSCSPISEAIR
jgi:hypothetical protein